jgi:hypothetical protein
MEKTAPNPMSKCFCLKKNRALVALMFTEADCKKWPRTIGSILGHLSKE